MRQLGRRSAAPKMAGRPDEVGTIDDWADDAPVMALALTELLGETRP
jgi:hypothetical protein